MAEDRRCIACARATAQLKSEISRDALALVLFLCVCAATFWGISESVDASATAGASRSSALDPD